MSNYRCCQRLRHINSHGTLSAFGKKKEKEQRDRKSHGSMATATIRFTKEKCTIRIRQVKLMASANVSAACTACELFHKPEGAADFMDTIFKGLVIGLLYVYDCVVVTKLIAKHSSLYVLCVVCMYCMAV